MRHISSAHRVDLDCLYDRINWDPTFQINYVNTTQHLADILTKGSFTGDTWTQLTLLANIMTHTTLTQSNLSVSSAVVNPLFSQHEQTCRRIFRCIGKRETKATSLHSDVCEENWRQECRHGLSHSTSTRSQSWRRLWAWRHVSARSSNTHHDGSSIIMIHAGGSDCFQRSVKHWWRESSSSGKRWWIRVHQEVRWSSGKLHSNWKTPETCATFHSVYRSGASSQATACGLDFGWARITRIGSEWRWTKRFTRTPDFMQSVQRQVQTLIEGTAAYNMQISQDWQTFRWSSITLLGDTASKLIRMKVHVFPDSTLCVGISNPNPSNSWATKLDGRWNEHGFAENRVWQPEKCNSFGTYHQVLPLSTTRSIFRHIWTGEIQNPFKIGSYLMSMFNDIDSTNKGNIEICLHNAKEVAAFGTQFKPEHWCFLESASEKTW